VSLLIVEVPLLLVQLTCLSFVSDRIRTVRLQCVRGRLTEAAPKEFQEGHLQQSQTIVTEYHMRRRTQSDDKEARKNRVTTKRALDKSDLCTFRFFIFLSSSDSYWYLSTTASRIDINRDYEHHTTHVKTDHHFMVTSDVSTEHRQFIETCIKDNMTNTQVRRLLDTQFNLSVSETTIRTIREQHIQTMFRIFFR
jgi:hypothetical protein